ncbi:hypothetical protein [Foetidibacter luteolus]|uniref:hypothetical protein n=1 Tax=Foetidibacter luteolus TaxID=2608880 RepID=UPI00129B6396|nr:hypothetical protein [Foetidibacter luteolus]
MAKAPTIVNDNEGLSNEQLMNYLKGNLSAEELHELELQMADSAFVNDAVEGLQAFSKDKKLEEYVAQLNGNLQEQLNNRRQLKEKRKIKNMQWPLVALIIILLLCFLGYVVVRMLK